MARGRWVGGGVFDEGERVKGVEKRRYERRERKVGPTYHMDSRSPINDHFNTT